MQAVLSREAERATLLRGLSHEQSGDATGRPTPTKDDALYVAKKAAISSIPYIGGALAEVFSATVASPISKRTADWWDDLARRVSALDSETEAP